MWFLPIFHISIYFFFSFSATLFIYYRFSYNFSLKPNLTQDKLLKYSEPTEFMQGNKAISSYHILNLTLSFSISHQNKQTNKNKKPTGTKKKNTLFWMTGSFLKNVEAKNLSYKLQGMTYPFLEMKEGKNRDSYLFKYSCDHRKQV